MNDKQKSKAQLIQELEVLRKEITTLRQETGIGAVLTSIDDTVFFINGDGIFKYFFGGPHRFDTALEPGQFIGKH